MSFDQWTQKQAQRLAHSIALQHTDADHDVCLDALEQYISAQLEQHDYVTLFPAIARHLDSCVACAAAYALVYEARTAEAADLARIAVPEPDLSFLPGGAALLQRRLAEAIERIAPRRWRFTLSQPLLDLLLPPHTPGLAFRSAAGDTPLLSLTLDPPELEQTQVQLSVYQDRQSPELCTLRAQLSLADREWPELAGIVVTIAMGGEQRQATTDPWGEVVFADLPKAALDGLQLDVDVDGPPQTST
jgi:hypothetical protein